MTPVMRTVLLGLVAAYLGAVSFPCMPPDPGREVAPAGSHASGHAGGHAHGAAGHGTQHPGHGMEHAGHGAQHPGHGAQHARHEAGPEAHGPSADESDQEIKAACPCGCDGDAPSPVTGQRLDRGLLAARAPVAVPAVQFLEAAPALRLVEVLPDPPDTVPILSRTV